MDRNTTVWQDIKKVTRDTAEAAWESIHEQLEPDAGDTPTAENLQAELLRFEGRFSERIRDSLGFLRASRVTEIRALGLNLQLVLTSSAIDIAVSARPDVALVDMITLVELSRKSAERALIPDVLGSIGIPLLKALREASEDVWKLSSSYLSSEQRQILKRAINRWVSENPPHQNFAGVRLAGVLDELRENEIYSEDLSKGFPLAGGVFQALETADKSRLLGERVFYYMQRAPFLARLHLRVLVLETIKDLKAMINDPRLKRTAKLALGSTLAIIFGSALLRRAWR